MLLYGAQCQWVGEHQHCAEPSFTAPFGKERIGPSFNVKKNEDNKIIPHVLPSIQSPCSTYKGAEERLSAGHYKAGWHSGWWHGKK